MDSMRPSDVSPDAMVTEWAIQYGTGGPFIADDVLPPVPVKNRSFKFQTYGSDQLNDEVETRVGPDGKPNEIRTKKPAFTSATTERNALDDQMSDELRSQLLNPILGEQNRIKRLIYRLRVGVERRTYALFHAATKTTAAGTAWDNASATALGARKNLDDAVDAMEKRGVAMGDPHVAIDIQTARVLARLVSAYIVSGDPTMFVGGMFPQGLWGYTWHIAGALQNTGNPKADFSQTVGRIWGADKEAFVFATNPTPDLETMAFGYQGVWYEWGVPYAGYTWRDPHQSVKKTWFSADNNQIELLVCDDAAQRITGVLT